MPATIAQRNAGFDVAKREMITLLNTKVPGWARGMIPPVTDAEILSVSNPVCDAAVDAAAPAAVVVK
jgi:hypothetical protein